MSEEIIVNLKKNIVAIGRLLWEKELASGLNGNMSVRVDDNQLLMTAHGTCLGLLKEKSSLLMNNEGELLEEGKISTEKLLHTEVLKNFPEMRAVIHTHTPYINGYFLNNEKFNSEIFEAKLYLGEVVGIAQTTPSVQDVEPVLEALKKNNIVVLRNHGVVAMGKDLFDCFLLIQGLEDAIKTDFIARRYSGTEYGVQSTDDSSSSQESVSNAKKYKLFSQEQIDEIVRVVNDDDQLKELGVKHNMDMDLAVKLDETGQVYSFRFKQGNIDEVGNDETAEFLVSAPEKVWRSVFNQEIDPFVATTQKKMNLRGDFAKISKFYAPCSRVFELWANVPVED